MLCECLSCFPLGNYRGGKINAGEALLAIICIRVLLLSPQICNNSEGCKESRYIVAVTIVE